MESPAWRDPGSAKRRKERRNHLSSFEKPTKLSSSTHGKCVFFSNILRMGSSPGTLHSEVADAEALAVQHTQKHLRPECFRGCCRPCLTAGFLYGFFSIWGAGSSWRSIHVSLLWGVLPVGSTNCCPSQWCSLLDYMFLHSVSILFKSYW